MKLELIAHYEMSQNKLIIRYITSVQGAPFYCSSGILSNCPHTWFFFFGITEKANQFSERGNYNIPYSIAPWPADVLACVRKAFPFADSIIQRFGSIPCMLISSWLGGGIWDLDSGKICKHFLELRYPKFYQSCSVPVLENPNKIQYYSPKNIEKINQWLCHKANSARILMPKGMGEDFTFKVMIPSEGTLSEIAKLDQLLKPSPADLRGRIEHTPKFTQLQVLTQTRPQHLHPKEIHTAPVKERRKESISIVLASKSPILRIR